MKTTALIVAAGAGVRMGRPRPKAFLSLCGLRVVEYSLAAFDEHPLVDGIILMVPEPMLTEAAEVAARFRKVAAVAAAAALGLDTVQLGLNHAGDADLILVHDAARPLVDRDLISRVIEAAARTGAAIPGVRPRDTIRKEPEPVAGEHRMGAGTHDRNGLVLVQTPQGFRLSLLREAAAAAGGVEVTDDAMLVEMMGCPVEVVEGSRRNFKLTTPDDLIFASALLAPGRKA